METHIGSSFGLTGQTYASKMNDDSEEDGETVFRKKPVRDYRAEGPDTPF
jgi:hypothetical protein